MQVQGAFLKRKSFSKIEPVMPRRDKSQKSREQSKRNHRTQHKSMNRPEIELTSYKRKNLVAFNQLLVNDERQIQSKKLQQLKTDRTKESTHLSEQSEGLSQKNTLQSSLQYPYYKVSSHSHPQQNNQRLNLINREQLTSRFTINLNEGQNSSLTKLLHQGKSKNSNPLINTARLTQHQNNNAFESLKIRNHGDINKNQNQGDSSNTSNNFILQSVPQVLSNLRQNNQDKIQPKESIEFQQKQSQEEGENFDDYQFGGIQSSNQFSNQLQAHKSKNSKTKIINFSPKTKPYEQNDLINQKPQNWKNHNRYIPNSESEHRMGLEIVKNQKASLQGKRQTKQINVLLQQYQKNKNSIHLQSQRKIESNRIIQNYYRERRINSQKNNSSSLPHLKVHSQPKHVVLIPLVEKNNLSMKNYQIDSSDNINTILHKIQQKSNVRSTLSYTKLGFGSSNPRSINNEDLDENQLQNVKNIQKKLRQKGIQFNSDTLRKALLDFRDGPISKLSKTQILGSSISYSNSLNKFEVPEKKLPSNAFYKIFPL